jgi:hypothetical protein
MQGLLVTILVCVSLIPIVIGLRVSLLFIRDHWLEGPQTCIVCGEYLRALFKPYCKKCGRICQKCGKRLSIFDTERSQRSGLQKITCDKCLKSQDAVARRRLLQQEREKEFAIQRQRLPQDLNEIGFAGLMARILGGATIKLAAIATGNQEFGVAEMVDIASRLFVGGVVGSLFAHGTRIPIVGVAVTDSEFLVVKLGELCDDVLRIEDLTGKGKPLQVQRAGLHGISVCKGRLFVPGCGSFNIDDYDTKMHPIFEFTPRNSAKAREIELMVWNAIKASEVK